MKALCLRFFVLALLVWPGLPAWAAPDLRGRAEQGGLLLGQTGPGDQLWLDGTAVPVAASGQFLLGFGRDAAPVAQVLIRHPAGGEESLTLAIAPRAWVEQRITGLPPAQAKPDPVALARIRTEAAKVAACRERITLDPAFVTGLVRPADGPVSGVFGSRRVYEGHPGSPHSGLDIAAPTGAPVRATAAGTVVLAESDLFLTGGTVLIDHGLGLISTYAHLSRVEVAVGQRVEAGTRIGAVGATGRATGPHLHFGLSWLDRRLDPEAVLASVSAPWP